MNKHRNREEKLLKEFKSDEDEMDVHISAIIRELKNV